MVIQHLGTFERKKIQSQLRVTETLFFLSDQL
jgi:hypothetical protein